MTVTSGIMKQAILANKAQSAVILTTLFNKVCSRSQQTAASMWSRKGRLTQQLKRRKRVFSFYKVTLTSSVLLFGCLSTNSADSPEMNELQLVRQWVSLQILQPVCDIFWGLLQFNLHPVRESWNKAPNICFCVRKHSQLCRKLCPLYFWQQSHLETDKRAPYGNGLKIKKNDVAAHIVLLADHYRSRENPTEQLNDLHLFR